MKDYPKHVISLPRVISFDEFKADTKEGKYAFVLNDPIHKETLDVLSNRKKEYLIQYFTYWENRHSVEYVILDMYEPYRIVITIMFPKAKYVVDPFHYIRYIMDALDKVRIRLQDQLKELFLDITNHVIYENWLENICNSFVIFKNGTLKLLKMVH